jgi:hypothetical protein
MVRAMDSVKNLASNLLNHDSHIFNYAGFYE